MKLRLLTYLTALMIGAMTAFASQRDWEEVTSPSPTIVQSLLEFDRIFFKNNSMNCCTGHFLFVTL